MALASSGNLNCAKDRSDAKYGTGKRDCTCKTCCQATVTCVLSASQLLNVHVSTAESVSGRTEVMALTEKQIAMNHNY